jgi:replicative DNA helicase
LIGSPSSSAAAVSKLKAQGNVRPPAHIGSVLRTAFHQIADAAERGHRLTGISTGYERLDAKTGGLHPGDLIVIASRPGMGKTAFALNLAVNIASPTTVRAPDKEGAESELLYPGGGVCLFSLETPQVPTSLQMASSEGRVDYSRVRQGLLQPDDSRRITEAASYIASLPIHIHDAVADVDELRTKIESVQTTFRADDSETTHQLRVGLVLVDSIQHIGGRGGPDNRDHWVREILRGLKQLAKDLELPVVAFCQLNSIEERTTRSRRPQMSDLLRVSNAIEQYADTIIFIHRDEYYNPRDSDRRGIAELIVAKQRNGPTGKVLLRFAGPYMRFDNLAPADYEYVDDDEE